MFDDQSLAVPFSEIETASTELDRRRGDIEADLASMDAQVRDLRSMFRGQAAVGFEMKWEEWSKASRDLQNSLEGIAGFLRTAAATFRDADEAIKKALG